LINELSINFSSGSFQRIWSAYYGWTWRIPRPSFRHAGESRHPGSRFHWIPGRPRLSPGLPGM